MEADAGFLQQEPPLTARVWLVLRRPLELLFVCGCAVSLWSSGRLSARLIADGMVSFAFLPGFQLVSFAVVYRRIPRQLRFARAADRFFAGNAPWLMWLALFAALRSVLTPQQAGAAPDLVWLVAQATLVGAVVWSARVDRRFFRDVLSGSTDATSDLLLQRTIAWTCSILYFFGIALWPEIIERIA